jgi:hypothetical protein
MIPVASSRGALARPSATALCVRSSADIITATSRSSSVAFASSVPAGTSFAGGASRNQRSRAGRGFTSNREVIAWRAVERGKRLARTKRRVHSGDVAMRSRDAITRCDPAMRSRQRSVAAMSRCDPLARSERPRPARVLRWLLAGARLDSASPLRGLESLLGLEWSCRRSSASEWIDARWSARCRNACPPPSGASRGRLAF